MVQYGYSISGNGPGRSRRRRNKKVPPPVLTPAELDELFPEEVYDISGDENADKPDQLLSQDSLTSAAAAPEAAAVTTAATVADDANTDAGVECGHEHSSSNSSRDEHRCCSICIEELVKGERVRVLSCGHLFHADCIKMWLVERHAVCPMCKVGFGRAEAGEGAVAHSVSSHSDAIPVSAAAF